MADVDVFFREADRVGSGREGGREGRRERRVGWGGGPLNITSNINRRNKRCHTVVGVLSIRRLPAVQSR